MSTKLFFAFLLFTNAVFSSSFFATLPSGEKISIDAMMLEKSAIACRYKGVGRECLLVGVAWSDKNAVEFIDYYESFKYLKIGCKANHGESCYLSGLACKLGEGTPKSKRRALRYFKKASRLGVVNADKELSDLL